MEAVFAKSIRVDPKRLRALSQKSDNRGWLQTGSHIGAIALNGLALSITWGTWLALPLFAMQGILINCLYAGVHELSHNTVFKSRRLSEYFGRLFCFILLMGRDQDKFEHFQHHRHTQDTEKDAEIVGGEPFTLRTYLLYISGITYWPARIGEVLRLALGQTDRWPHLSDLQFEKVHKEARLMLLGYGLIAFASIASGSAIVLQVWLLPMFCTKWFHMLQNTVEHTGMPHEKDILVNTRTAKANAVMRWLLWNMPYHTAHHSYPMIPFHQLPDLHADIVDLLGHEPPTISHLGFQKHMIRKLLKEGTSKYTGKDISAY
ncbi:MAG: fatty acid desaturase [Pseudomonadota bacterium]